MSAMKAIIESVEDMHSILANNLQGKADAEALNLQANVEIERDLDGHMTGRIRVWPTDHTDFDADGSLGLIVLNMKPNGSADAEVNGRRAFVRNERILLYVVSQLALWAGRRDDHTRRVAVDFNIDDYVDTALTDAEQAVEIKFVVFEDKHGEQNAIPMSGTTAADAIRELYEQCVELTEDMTFVVVTDTADGNVLVVR